MEPHDAVQVTAVVAENCMVPFTSIFGFVGEMENPVPPVPPRETVWGLLVALSVNLRVADRAPEVEGVNVILTAQLALPARLAPQVLAEIAKSAAFVPDTEMLLIFITDPAPFVSVTDCAGLVEPTAVVAKLKLPGVTVAMGPLAAPERATVWGLFPAESVNVRVAVRGPLAEGVNVTLTAQLALPARLVPQVLAEIAKSAAFVPDTEMLLIFITDPAPFVSVTDCAGAVEPMAVAAKVRPPGVTLAVVALPVPERATVCGLFPAESVKDSVAVRGPVAEGVNLMLTLQFAAPARLVPQVFAEIAKSAALAPATAMPPMLIAAVPPFVKATDCAALAVPTVIDVNERLDGVTLTLTPRPVPERATVWGLFPAESVKDSVAVRGPVAEGVNVMLTLQLAAPAKLVPQVLAEIAKSAALAPATATLPMLTAAVPPFVKVTDCAELAVPTVVAVNESIDGVTLMFTAAMTDPERATVCGLFPAESAKERVAVRGPVAEGVNVMLTVQLAEPATLVPQVLAEIAKSAGSAPLMEALMFEIAADPPLRSVTTWAGLVEPILLAIKESEDGSMVAEPAATIPTPDRETVVGDWPESINTRLACRVPATVGAKIRSAAQLEPASSVLPQVLLAIEKSPAAAPESAISRMLIADDPAFVSVTACELAREPTAMLPHETLVGLTKTADIDAQPVNRRQ
jgi:hypothetical protein